MLQCFRICVFCSFKYTVIILYTATGSQCPVIWTLPGTIQIYVQGDVHLLMCIYLFTNLNNHTVARYKYYYTGITVVINTVYVQFQMFSCILLVQWKHASQSSAAGYTIALISCPPFLSPAFTQLAHEFWSGGLSNDNL